MQNTYKIGLIAISILSVIMATTTIMSESLAHPASKKLNDRATALDKEAEQAKKDGNDVKSFAKSFAASKLREKVFLPSHMVE